MAFIQKTTSATFPVIYNLDQAVGTQAPNKQGDVRLVQFMLQNYYRAAEISVDGWIGPVTSKWIKKFQADMANAGNNVLQDGRIDRAFGKQSSVSGTVYTIVLLNFALAKSNPLAYARIPQQVPLNPNPPANPYNDAPGTMGGIAGIVDKIITKVTVEATSQGVMVRETRPGSTGPVTTIYTIPYFNG